VILVVAGALDLEGLAVEEESFLCVEVSRAHAEDDPFGIPRCAVGGDGNNGRVEIRHFDRPQCGIRESRTGAESHGAVGSDLLRGRLCSGDGLPCCVQNLPVHLCVFILFALVFDDRLKSKRGGTAGDGRAHHTLPLTQMKLVHLIEPDMPIDTGAFVKPAVAEAGVDAHHNVVLFAAVQITGEIKAKWRIAVVVAADEEAVDEDQHVAKGAVELNPDAAALVTGWHVEFATIPTDATFRIAATQRLVAVRLLLLIPDKGQLNGPVVRQVVRAPLRVVEARLGEFEVARLCEISLPVSEAEVLGRVVAIAEGKPPGEVKE